MVAIFPQIDRELDLVGGLAPAEIDGRGSALSCVVPRQLLDLAQRDLGPRIAVTVRDVGAGAVIVGKTETVEFAAGGRKAPTTNPHDRRRTPGGSSSGSAAAVADFHVPLAFGTQTGGSLIRPASFCGLYALKPSWGLVSREGAKLASLSCDTIGWYAREISDLSLVAQVFQVVSTWLSRRR